MAKAVHEMNKHARRRNGLPRWPPKPPGRSVMNYGMVTDIPPVPGEWLGRNIARRRSRWRHPGRAR